MRRPSGVNEMPRRTTDSVGNRVMSAPSSQMCPSVTGAAPMIAGERGRLPRAVRAQQGQHLARAGLERHVLHGTNRAVADGQPLDA